jgi:hypothetical protein
MKEFVIYCDVYARTKNPHQSLHGFLQPLLICASLWFLISMYFIVNLPLSSSYDNILMVLNHLTKVTHFIPCTKTIIGGGTTKLSLDHVFWYHGLLEDDIF